MQPSRTRRQRALLATALGLAGLGLLNQLSARLAERRHPPKGRFLTVDGIRLHYTDRGEGSPVVLIHGNAVSGDDWETSLISPILSRSHRVVAFDRPGFGHSDRPRGRSWTADAQADLLHAALRRLGVERPVLVGHSWGTLAALAMAERHSSDVAGLVLVSGYYFESMQLDALQAGVGVSPVLGDLLRNTIVPVLGWLQTPFLKRILFDPAPVPPRFHKAYSPAMALRPSQLRATFGDGALMIPGVSRLRPHYRELRLPVVILAGDGDKVVALGQAERLQAALPHASLRIVRGAGHMVHHLAQREVVHAVECVGGAAPRAG